MLLQVVEPVIADTTPLGPHSLGYDADITALRRSEAHDYLKRLAERLGQQGVRATAAAVLGPTVAATILDTARRQGVDLMAVATRGHGGIRRLAFGSTADKLVRAAEVPVLVIRPTKPSRLVSGLSGRSTVAQMILTGLLHAAVVASSLDRQPPGRSLGG